MRSSWPCVLAAAAALVPTRHASAAERELPILTRKLYPTHFNPEFSLLFDTSLAERYTTHQGPRLSAVFHLLDQLALEVHGGYMLGAESSIMRILRDKSKLNRRQHDDREPALPGLQQLTYHFGADVQVAPVYGKLSFVSELDLSFQLYAILGAGIAGTRVVTDATNTLACGNVPSAVGRGCAQFLLGRNVVGQVPGISPSGNDILGPGEYQLLPLAVPAEYGLGFRLMLGRWVSARAELRNHHWLGVSNRFDLNVVEDADDEAGCNQGYRAANGILDPVFRQLTSGARPCYLNVHSMTLARFGLSIMIPVNAFF